MTTRAIFKVGVMLAGLRVSGEDAETFKPTNTWAGVVEDIPNSESQIGGMPLPEWDNSDMEFDGLLDNFKERVQEQIKSAVLMTHN